MKYQQTQFKIPRIKPIQLSFNFPMCDLTKMEGG